MLFPESFFDVKFAMMSNATLITELKRPAAVPTP
jgi:hypothetical protein